MTHSEQSSNQPTAPMTLEVCLQKAAETLPEWQIIDRDGIMKLTRRFAFNDFAGALAFTQQVGELAEQAGHHPSITTQWGSTIVTWWSHDMGGLCQSDFILAAKTDEVANQHV